MKKLVWRCWSVALLCGLYTALPAQLSFVNRTNTLHFPNVFSGAPIGIADMNGDGLDDIVRLNQTSTLLIDYQTPPLDPNFDGSTPLSLTGTQWSICVADYNNDGNADIFTGGAYNGLKVLEANLGGTAYTITNIDNGVFLQSSNFADINNDGLVDIFACHDDGISHAYRNTGSGFVYDPVLINPVSTVPSDNSGNYGSVWTDFDNDGDLDLYISKCRLGVSDPGDGRRRNQLFRNNGNNQFTDVAGLVGLLPLGQSWATDFADIDNDGDLDAFIINHDIPNKLYLNNGSGQFTDITALSGIAGPTAAAGPGIQCHFADFDNDGYVDLLYTSLGGDDALLRNNGDVTFTNFGQFLPLPKRMQTAATGDVNNDGFIDIIAGLGDGFNSPGVVPDQLLINNANSFNYLKIRLTGVQSNRDGIGARLALYGNWGIQVREVRSGESYGTMHSLTQHFGMGTASVADSLVIRWPSGVVDVIAFPAGNQTLQVTEGSSCAVSFGFSATQNGSLAVSFLDQSTVGADSVFWNFGDSQTSSAQNPVHTYPAPGNYTVCLSVYGLCEDGQICKDVAVSCSAPEVIFGLAANGLTITTNNQTQNSPDNFLWTFGDGTNSTLLNPTHTYTDVGSYQVCLLAVNDCGSNNSCTTITIGCGGFSAGFSYQATELTVGFNGQATGAGVTTWNWNFGNGATATGQNVGYTYPGPGTYTVCLTTVGSCDSLTICQSLTLNCSVPPLGFSAQIDQLVASFAPDDIAAFDSLVWDFGDGTTSTDSLPTHTYTTPGAYTVCLEATSPCGTATVCDTLQVSCVPPAAGFSLQTDELTVTLTNMAGAGVTSWLYTFGNGSNSMMTSPVYTYPAPGTYTVCQFINSPCGSSSSCQQVTVSCAPPSTGFDGTVNNLQVVFQHTSSPGVTTLFWDFGDGTTSMSPNPQHTYAMAATYTVCLTATSPCGATTVCQNITTICSLPPATILSDMNELVFTFSNVAQNDGLSFAWTFGDGTTSNLPSPTHTYAALGTYEVCLTVSNSCGAQTTCMTVVAACPAPTAQFQYTITGLTVSLSPTIGGDFSQVLWTFGENGTMSTQVAPTHTYTQAGTYEVCFTVSSICGSDQHCETITLTCSPASADFVFQANQLIYNFVYAGNGEPTAYLWTFGGGNESDLSSPVYQFSTPGQYQVCLTIFDDCGSNQLCKTITVSCLTPQAEFNYTTDNYLLTLTEMVVANDLDFFWDFGDGTTSSVPDAEHTYAATGMYQVCLTVTNACGFTERCETVSITCPSPSAGFTALATNLDLSFLAADTSATTYTWLFGDGGMAQGSDPQHTYAAPGSYTVCLTAANECGATESCQTVTVSCLAPTAGFSQDTQNGATTFTDTSLNDPTSWLWTFGDGGSDTTATPLHQYAANGTYTVCLTVGNECGQQTICNAIAVIVSATVQIDATSSLQVYPNPVSDWLWIATQGQLSERLELSLWSADGRLQRRFLPFTPQTTTLQQLDLTGLPAGLYHLRFQSSRSVWTVPIVKL